VTIVSATISGSDAEFEIEVRSNFDHELALSRFSVLGVVRTAKFVESNGPTWRFRASAILNQPAEPEKDFTVEVVPNGTNVIKIVTNEIKPMSLATSSSKPAELTYSVSHEIGAIDKSLGSFVWLPCSGTGTVRLDWSTEKRK